VKAVCNFTPPKATQTQEVKIMTADPITQIAALDIEPTYSAREAAALLGRSFSWLDQRVRNGDFVLPDGTVVQPLRTPGGYRRFTLEMLKDIVISSYNNGWFSMNKLRSTFNGLAMAAYRRYRRIQDPWLRGLGWSSTSTGS
jgi:hypothetical protein